MAGEVEQAALVRILGELEALPVLYLRTYLSGFTF